MVKWKVGARVVAPAVIETLLWSATLAAGPKGKTAFKALGARIKALGVALVVDLAGIEFGALFLIAKDVIGAADFLKALFGALVTALGIGVVLLGQRTKRLLDLGFTGVLGNAKDVIGIAHRFSARPGARPPNQYYI